MSETLTKAAARNIFYGGTAFFFVVFVALTAHSVSTANDIAKANPVTASVAAGKHVWEKNACIDCHTLMGEGAYYAPELGNVWVRFGGREDASGAREALKAWMKGQPSGIEGRRQMPQFNLTETQLNDLVDFLKWTSEVDTQNWPPKVSG
ncbi:MAG: cytochrome c [Rhodospirillaceae bacterium]|nr:cytochrome c [Rhodospirillales bacterium]